ncbi:MAG: heavy-metal-associated domain-containing protein [Acidimicrobiia bacterium]|nr:heavy-metal-associated domain-containing protein [Acidimicrobiia bacterium]
MQTTGQDFDGKRQSAVPGPIVQVTRLAIDGMTCESCSERVEQALSSVPGVRHARVDLLAGQATLQVEAVPSDTLIAAVANEGYSARILTGLESPRPENQRPARRCCENG